MKAHRVLILILPLLLTACAQNLPQTTTLRSDDSSVMESVNSRARIHTELASLYYARQQYSVALQEIRQALQADSSYAPAYMMLGLVHEALLEYKEADDSFRRSLDLAPQYSEAHNNYGLFLCNQKRYDEAMSQFEMAWKNPLYETPEKAYANAGQCALRMGDLTKAENYTRRALIRAPNQTQALLTLAEIQYRQGQMALAHSTLRQVGTPSALDAASLWLGVKVEHKLGNRAAEAEYAAQLHSRYPESQEYTWMQKGQFDR